MLTRSFLHSDVHHAAHLGLQAPRGVVGQRLCAGNAHTDGNARATQHSGPDVPAQGVQILDAGQIRKGFINRVHLNGRYKRFYNGHYALAYVAVKREIGRKCHNPVLPELVLNLKVRLAHFDEGRGIVAAAQSRSRRYLKERRLAPWPDPGETHAHNWHRSCCNRLGRTRGGGLRRMAAHSAGDNAPNRQLITFQDVPRRVLRVF